MDKAPAYGSGDCEFEVCTPVHESLASDLLNFLPLSLHCSGRRVKERARAWTMVPTRTAFYIYILSVDIYILTYL
jgi:hypothetical protein